MKNQFQKNNISIFLYAVIIVVFSVCLILPNKSYAAVIRASSSSALSAGDTSIFDIYLDTEGEQINSIDGSLVLSDTHNGNFEIKELSVVNSIFTLWPRKPSIEAGGIVTFVGGVPGGMYGDRLLLFRIIVKINEPGDFSIKPNSVTAYLNDGLGTPRNIVNDVSVISVGVANEIQANKWQEVISSDNIPPEPFSIEVLQDAYLYNGMKFLSFETTDSKSGISYYEVIEGTYPAVRSGTNYVLIDQNQTVDVTVVAYDKAGNLQLATLESKEPINWIAILVVVLLVLSLYAMIKMILMRKYNAKSSV